NWPITSSGSRAAEAGTATRRIKFSPWLHQALFGALLISALCHGWNLFAPHLVLVVVTHGLLLALITLAIVTLVRNYEGMRDSLLAKVTWMSLVVITVQGLAVYIMYMLMITTMRNPRAVYNNWAVLSAYIEFQLSGRPFPVGVTAGCAVIDLLLGGIGFLALWAHKRPGRK
ncbi:hypothetical protein, partial [Desulfosarcina cetonica]|uniref:hypothetical protein n=1 Tax=Desulfosarcina cetonica TaxID=90730 RepID=UPI00155D9C5D